MSNTKLKSVISKQIPEFVRSDHPGFVQFIEAYYEYLDQYERRDIENLRDLDKTLDDFITFIKGELNVYGQEEYAYIDKILMLRKIKQLFVAKGTETAYKFLFKILFDKPISISYPWDVVLKCSDGKWNRDTTIFVRVESGDPTQLVGNKATIINGIRSIGIYVSNVRLIRTGVYEVFIDRNYYGTIDVGDSVYLDGLFTGTILSTTTGYVIEQGGVGFKVGDLITGASFVDGEVVTQLVKVTKVDTDGAIQAISTVRFNCGYATEFFLLTSKEAIVRTSNISIDLESVNQFSLPDDTAVTQYEDYGVIVKSDYWDSTYGENTYVGAILQQFYDKTVNGQVDTSNFALIRFNIGSVAKYQGYYSSTDGFLSDNIYLQDSKYYQKFSYLITVDERLEDYKTLVKSYLHPAGAAIFGEYQIQNTYVSSLNANLTLDFFTPNT